jgi:predicted transcriptional regulator
MAKEHHIGYPVLNDKNEPVGEVTLLEASQIDKSKRAETRVEQIMRKKLVTANPDETGLDVFKKMSENETGRVAVVDPTDNKKLLGIVTKADLMDVLTKHPEHS